MATNAPAEPPETLDSADDQVEVSPAELLDLLGDEYTRRVLAAVADKPRTGREIIDATEVSKATVYRRLDDLQAAGLVESELRIDPNGHHCEQFFAVFERAGLACASEAFDELDLTCSESG